MKPVCASFRTTVLILLFSLGCTVANAQDQPIAIKGATLINPGEDPRPNTTVLIKGDMIEAVGSNGSVDIPEQAKIIDGGGKYITPGMFDTHVHFFQSGGLYTRPDIIDLRDRVPYDKELKRIKNSLDDTFRRYLRSGVTSVADVGGPMWNFEVRRQARESAMAPNVEVAGPLISSYQPDALTTDDPPIIRPESPEGARRLVRKQVEHGTDFIKIWYIVRSGQDPADHRALVSATIDEADKHEKPVLVHATELATARAAVKAGADILVHSVTDTVVTDRFAELLREEEVIYTPTLTVFESYPEVFSQQIDLTLQEHKFANPEVISSLFDLTRMPPDAQPGFVRRAIEQRDTVKPDRQALKNLKKLNEAGVTIAAGTDAGNIGTPHGPAIYREFELMRQAGLTPREILKTATINGAKFMGRSDELGSVEPGKLADLLVLNSNPLEDIHNTADLHRLVKSGNVFQPRDLLDFDSDDIVQKQVNAYNAGDLEAFVHFYSDSIRIYNHPNKFRFGGREELYKRYGPLFKNNPGLNATIKNRITQGHHVVDDERVTGHAKGDSLQVIVHYVVRDGKIQKVYFIR